MAQSVSGPASGEVADGRRAGVQVISRAAAILHMLAREQTGLTLTEIVARTGLAKSTAYRIVVALQAEDLIESFDGRFTLGRILRGTTMSNSEEVRVRARPFMERLASELKETVDLSVLVGDQLMIVEQMRWLRELTAGAVVGSLMPAAKTSSGRALLACMPNYREFALARDGEDQRWLLDELTRIRRSKIAISDQGYHTGISGIATFARDNSGNGYALGVPVPSVRFHEQLPNLRRALLAARPEFERIVSGG